MLATADPCVNANVWYALLATRGAPRDIVSRLNTEVTKLLKNSELRQHFPVDGIVPVGSTPEELGAYIKSETVKWANVVQRSGAKID
jgi:tripartite-type tricarboxylate transporter receptor subunit TctC